MITYLVDGHIKDDIIKSNIVPLQYQKYRLPFEHADMITGPFGCLLNQAVSEDGWFLQHTDLFINRKMRLCLHTPQPLVALQCMLLGQVPCYMSGCGDIMLKSDEINFFYVPPDGNSWADFPRGHFQSVHIAFTPAFLSRFIASDPHLKILYSKLLQQGPDGYRLPVCTLAPRVLEQIEKIRKCRSQGITRQLYYQSRIHDLLFFYFSSLQETGRNSVAHKEKTIRELADYIADSLSESVTVSTLARLAGMNHFVLLREFRKVFHQSPVEYIQQQRIERAAHLLKDTTYTIAHIALSVGFTDAAYFSRVFSHHIGCSPSVYRKRSGGIPEHICSV